MTFLGRSVALVCLPALTGCATLFLGVCAVDFGEASVEERDVLRYVAAALMVPLAR